MAFEFWSLLSSVAAELLLFSANGFLVFGLDDLCVDLIWVVRCCRRRIMINRRSFPSDAGMFPEPGDSLALAVFIPAWDESAVIGHMVRRCIKAWEKSHYSLFIGFYPNDPLTFAELTPFASPTVHLVEMPHHGPTTKADCLNALWTAMLKVERNCQHQFRGVLLHDAEDFVHADELRIFNGLTDRLALIQLPVRPEVDLSSRWISGHYLDEFAEAHLKDMIVREVVGASLPSAGTGCCINRALLGRIASLNGGTPFDADSLTEDYELGLRIGAMGGRSALVRIRESAGDQSVAIRAHFPATLKTALRQKSRWVAGIALAGWDRTGWRGGLAEHWMRWRDRRSLMSALFILAGYSSIAIVLILLCAGQDIIPNQEIRLLLIMNGLLLTWRLILRSFCVAIVYDRREALRSLPRIIISNMIAVMASFIALGRYWRMLKTGKVTWDKTGHKFPGTPEALQ
jgi:bacteriophage N4 adsorption protein B